MMMILNNIKKLGIVLSLFIGLIFGVFSYSEARITNPPIGGGSGEGDVTKVGTPIDNQVGVWTGDGTIEGTNNLIFDGSFLKTIFLSNLAGDNIIDMTNSPDMTFFTDTNKNQLELGPTGAVFNDNENSVIDFLIKAANGLTAFFADSSTGNVGIGETTPTSKLDIVQTGNNSGLSVYSNVGATASEPLMTLTTDNADFDQSVLSIESDVVDGVGIILGVGGVTPKIKFGDSFTIQGDNGNAKIKSIFNLKEFRIVNNIDEAKFRVKFDTGSTDINANANSASDLVGLRVNVDNIGAGEAYSAIFETGNVGIGTTSPSEVLSVQGNVLADAYLEYSKKYIGDALAKLEAISCEEGTEDGDWCDIDHDTLPAGLRYEKDGFVGRDIGKSIQFNLKSIQDLYALSTSTAVIQNTDMVNPDHESIGQYYGDYERPPSQNSVFAFVNAKIGKDKNELIRYQGVINSVQDVVTIQAAGSTMGDYWISNATVGLGGMGTLTENGYFYTVSDLAPGQAITSNNAEIIDGVDMKHLLMIDEDNMVSDENRLVPTQQSVKAYIDAKSLASGSGDMLAATYDPTAVAGDVFSMGNMVEGITTKILTDLERTIIGNQSGVNTGDMSDLDVKTAYENNANTNAFEDLEKTRLAGMEDGATDNQTGAEIKIAYEAEANTNSYTDAEKVVVGNTSNINTGDAVIATGAEIDTGIDNIKMVTAKAIADSGLRLWEKVGNILSPLAGEDVSVAGKITSTSLQLGLGIINEFSIDGLFTGNSDTAIPTEKAVKTYVDTKVDINKVGTPIDNQIGVWTGDGTIEGTSGLTYDGSTMSLDGDLVLTSLVSKIGLGVIPTAAIDIAGLSGNETIIKTTRYSDNNFSPNLVQRKARGTETVPLDVNVDDTLLGIQGYGYKDGDFRRAGIIGITAEKTSTDVVQGAISFSLANSFGILETKMKILSDGEVGIGTITPSAKLEIVDNKNALTDIGMSENYLQILRNSESATGQSAGLGFSVTSTDNNLGAAIIHRRTDSNSMGELQFYTKQSSLGSVDPEMAMTITDTGRVDMYGDLRVRDVEVATDTEMLTVDADGVVHKQAVPEGGGSAVYSGYTWSNGLSSNLPTGWSSTQEAIGTYKITHTLGTSAYNVVATVADSGSRRIDTSSYTSTSFYVKTYFVDDTLYDSDFTFMVMEY